MSLLVFDIGALEKGALCYPVDLLKRRRTAAAVAQAGQLADAAPLAWCTVCGSIAVEPRAMAPRTGLPTPERIRAGSPAEPRRPMPKEATTVGGRVSNTVADSRLEVRFDGGRTCLDLLCLNLSGTPRERSRQAVKWVRGAGLVPPGTPVVMNARWIQGLRELRSTLDALFVAQLAGSPPAPDAVARLNDLARTAPPAPRAELGPDGLLTLALAAPPDAATVLAVVARDAVDLLTDPAARSQLRRCESETCFMIYLDTSRGRRRRWCSSASCGNRERVARHRRRKGGALPGP